VAAGHHFFVHPEDVTYWRRIGREARGLWSELTIQARAEPVAAPSPLRMEPEPASADEAAADDAPPAFAEPDEVKVAAAGPPPGESSLPGSLLSESSPSGPLAPEASESAWPAPAVVEPAPTPAPEPTATGPTPSPTPTPKATPKATPKPTPRRSQPSAFLSVGFEHHLESGTLEVWVDGKRVAKEALDSRVTRNLLLLELRQGSVQQTLSLSPGRHEVRVRLRSGDDVKSARTSATFRSGATRRLEVSAPRLRGGLTLKWK
jgi:hypothetical protein